VRHRGDEVVALKEKDGGSISVEDLAAELNDPTHDLSEGERAVDGTSHVRERRRSAEPNR
jgi:hypothetical protein